MKILRLAVGVALVPIGALITFTVKTRVIVVSQQEKRTIAHDAENKILFISTWNVPVGRRFRFWHLIQHACYLLPVIKVFPLVIELQNDTDNLQNLQIIPYIEKKKIPCPTYSISIKRSCKFANLFVTYRVLTVYLLHFICFLH